MTWMDAIGEHWEGFANPDGFSLDGGGIHFSSARDGRLDMIEEYRNFKERPSTGVSPAMDDEAVPGMCRDSDRTYNY